MIVLEFIVLTGAVTNVGALIGVGTNAVLFGMLAGETTDVLSRMGVEILVSVNESMLAVVMTASEFILLSVSSDTSLLS